MRLVREIKESLWAECNGAIWESIIAAKLEPVRDKLRLLVNEGISPDCVEASAEQPWSWDGLGNAPTLKDLAKEILAMLSEEGERCN